MKIIYILNKVSHTSIPLEIASKISEFEEVTILSLYDSASTGRKIAMELAPKCKFVACNGKKNLISGLLKLRKEILTGSYDIVHTHQTLSGATARYFSKDLKNTKTVHTIHAHHDSFNIWQNLIIGLTLKYSNFLVSNSQTTLLGLKEWQKKLVKDIPTKVIYNGVNVYDILNADTNKTKELFKQYEICEADTVFGLVGRFVKVKNHKNVLMAFEKFLQEKGNNGSYRLVLVGDGPEKENINDIIENSNLLKDRVILTGVIERSAVYSLLHKIDIFIMASFQEGFCNALMEAKVVGLRTIISRIDIFTELYKSDYMISFNPYEIDEIKDSMMKAIDTSFVPENNDEIIEKYDISTSVNEYLELYKTI